MAIDAAVGKDFETVGTAAAFVLRHGLGTRRSAVDPAELAWTFDVAEEVRAAIEDSPDMGPDSFLVKLERQLSGRPRPVVLLAAELVYLHSLPLSNVKGETKLRRVEQILSWLPDAPELPAEMRLGLQTNGLFNGGTGFNVQIFQQVLWLCRFVKTWDRLDPESREEALRNPLDFRRAVESTPGDQPGIRNALLVLMWPDYYDNVVNEQHKRAIRNAYAYVIGGASGDSDADVDVDLHAIRRRLQSEGQPRIDWYVEPWSAQWQKDVATGQRAWLVRSDTASPSTPDFWFSESTVTMPARHLPQVPAGSDRAAVGAAVEEGFDHLDYPQRLQLTSDYFLFLTRMKAGDLVVAMNGERFRIGEVQGQPGTSVTKNPNSAGPSPGIRPRSNPSSSRPR